MPSYFSAHLDSSKNNNKKKKEKKVVQTHWQVSSCVRLFNGPGERAEIIHQESPIRLILINLRLLYLLEEGIPTKGLGKYEISGERPKV